MSKAALQIHISEQSILWSWVRPEVPLNFPAPFDKVVEWSNIASPELEWRDGRLRAVLPIESRFKSLPRRTPRSINPPPAFDAGIKERVLAACAWCRSEDKNFRVFGAASHRYELNPTLSESDIREFEAKHDVSLPPDYRWFLEEVSNGGAGPSYGILPLSATRNIRRPFPAQRITDILAWGDCNGTIPICDHGCAFESQVVVRSRYFGQVWGGGDDRSFVAPSFLDYYLSWIDGLENDLPIFLANEARTKQLRIGMKSAEVIDIVGLPYNLTPMGLRPGAETLLSFEMLAKQFTLNGKGVVVHIQAYPINLG